MRVAVTQECIDQGLPNKAFLCPIALALQLAGFEDVSVTQDNIRYSTRGERGTVTVQYQPLSRLWHRRVRRYDSTGRMAPGYIYIKEG